MKLQEDQAGKILGSSLSPTFGPRYNKGLDTYGQPFRGLDCRANFTNAHFSLEIVFLEMPMSETTNKEITGINHPTGKSRNNSVFTMFSDARLLLRELQVILFSALNTVFVETAECI